MEYEYETYRGEFVLECNRLGNELFYLYRLRGVKNLDLITFNEIKHFYVTCKDPILMNESTIEKALVRAINGFEHSINLWREKTALNSTT